MKVYNTLVVVTQIGQVEQCSAGCCPKGCAWNEVCAEVTGYVGVTGMATQTSPTLSQRPNSPMTGAVIALEWYANCSMSQVK